MECEKWMIMRGKRINEWSFNHNWWRYMCYITPQKSFAYSVWWPISAQIYTCSIFCYMSYFYYGSLFIQLTHNPNIIGVQFQWDEYQLHEWVFCKVPNIHQCMHWTIFLSVLLNLLCPVHTYRLTILKVCFALTLITMIIITMIDPYSDMPRLSLVDKASAIGQIHAGFTKKWMIEFVSRVGQENVLLGQHAVQAWTPFDSYGTSWGELFIPDTPSRPAGYLSDMSGMLYHSSMFSGSYPVWGGGTRLLLGRLVVLPTTSVINVSNEVYCGETVLVFNLNLLITTGDRYIKVSLINVILALFSDDPHPITNPIIQCTKISQSLF